MTALQILRLRRITWLPKDPDGDREVMHTCSDFQLCAVTTSTSWGRAGASEDEEKTGGWIHSGPWKKEGASAQFGDFDSFP